MRCHKKTKESGFFEGDSDSSEVNMGKALKRTNVFTASSESNKRKVCERIEYTQDELDTHIRTTNCSKTGKYLKTILKCNRPNLTCDLRFKYCYSASRTTCLQKYAKEATVYINTYLFFLYS